MDGFVLSVERMIGASPEAIFEVLADVSRHSLIDGSGMVQGAKEEGSPRLALGVTFGMGMKMGLRYSTVNTVVEFEENRRIAWQTGLKGRFERLVAGRIWRYELEPRDGGTLVRESWDITPDHQRVLLKLGYSGKTRRDMERTLARLDAVATTPATASQPMQTGPGDTARSLKPVGRSARPPKESTMDDGEIITRIGSLADEERHLEERHVGTGLSPDEEQRLRTIEVTLDRMWDLLRQRRALRDAGKRPDEADLRPEGTVEGYQQ